MIREAGDLAELIEFSRSSAPILPISRPDTETAVNAGAICDVGNSSLKHATLNCSGTRSFMRAAVPRIATAIEWSYVITAVAPDLITACSMNAGTASHD